MKMNYIQKNFNGTLSINADGFRRLRDEQAIKCFNEKSFLTSQLQFFCCVCNRYQKGIRHGDNHWSGSKHKKLVQTYLSKKKKILNIRLINNEEETALSEFLVNMPLPKKLIGELNVKMRNKVSQDLEDTIKSSALEGIKVHLYGSSVTKIGFEDDNVNIDLDYDLEEVSRVYPDITGDPLFLIHIRDTLKKSSKFCDVKDFFHMIVPKLTFTHVESGFHCIICPSHKSGMFTSLLIMNYLSIDERAKILCSAFRCWAMLCGVDDTDSGSLSPFCYSLMVIHYLQQLKPPVLPVIKIRDYEHVPPDIISCNEGKIILDQVHSWESDNSSSLGKLWVGLFRYYLLDFYVKTLVVNITQIAPMTKDLRKFGSKRVIAIEDPYVAKDNVAKTIGSSSMMEYIFDCMETSLRYFSCTHLHKKNKIENRLVVSPAKGGKDNTRKKDREKKRRSREISSSTVNNRENAADHVHERDGTSVKTMEESKVSEVLDPIHDTGDFHNADEDAINENEDFHNEDMIGNSDVEIEEEYYEGHDMKRSDKKSPQEHQHDGALLENLDGSDVEMMEHCAVRNSTVDESSQSESDRYACSHDIHGGYDSQYDGDVESQVEDERKSSNHQVNPAGDGYDYTVEDNVKDSMIGNKQVLPEILVLKEVRDHDEKASEMLIQHVESLSINYGKVAAEPTIESLIEDACIETTGKTNVSKSDMLKFQIDKNENSSSSSFACEYQSREKSVIDEYEYEVICTDDCKGYQITESSTSQFDELENGVTSKDEVKYYPLVEESPGSAIKDIPHSDSCMIESPEGDTKEYPYTPKCAEERMKSENKEYIQDDIKHFNDNDSEEENQFSSSLNTITHDTAPVKSIDCLKLQMPLNTPLQFSFSRGLLASAESAPIFCRECGQDGHKSSECEMQIADRIKLVAQPANQFFQLLSKVCKKVMNELEIPQYEYDKRYAALREMERHLRKHFNEKCRLDLFGSSFNTFGTRFSDMDVCLRFESDEAPCELDQPSMVVKIAKALDMNTRYQRVMYIKSAKVPIVKFRIAKHDLEGDISLYNSLALRNSQMIMHYASIDDRVRVLGYCVKHFAKICKIGDASRGSLSSYAYILLILYYLQHCSPPVIPVLQEMYNHERVKPKSMVEGWNTWYYDRIDFLKETWPGYCKNNKSVGELWLGFFRFYVEEFDLSKNAVSIKQFKRLSKFEKGWTNAIMAIEDPFNLKHNLAAGINRNMYNYIMSCFQNALHHFANDDVTLGTSLPDLLHYFFSPATLTASKHVPKDRLCYRCGRIGHTAGNCAEKIVADRDRRRLDSEKNNVSSDNGDSDGYAMVDSRMEKKKCFGCDKFGHRVANCPNKESKKSKGKKSLPEGNFTTKKETVLPLENNSTNNMLNSKQPKLKDESFKVPEEVRAINSLFGKGTLVNQNSGIDTKRISDALNEVNALTASVKGVSFFQTPPSSPEKDVSSDAHLLQKAGPRRRKSPMKQMKKSSKNEIINHAGNISSQTDFPPLPHSSTQSQPTTQNISVSQNVSSAHTVSAKANSNPRWLPLSPPISTPPGYVPVSSATFTPLLLSATDSQSNVLLQGRNAPRNSSAITPVSKDLSQNSMRNNSLNTDEITRPLDIPSPFAVRAVGRKTEQKSTMNWEKKQNQAKYATENLKSDQSIKNSSTFEFCNFVKNYEVANSPPKAASSIDKTDCPSLDTSNSPPKKISSHGKSSNVLFAGKKSNSPKKVSSHGKNVSLHEDLKTDAKSLVFSVHSMKYDQEYQPHQSNISRSKRKKKRGGKR